MSNYRKILDSDYHLGIHFQNDKSSGKILTNKSQKVEKGDKAKRENTRKRIKKLKRTKPLDSPKR